MADSSLPHERPREDNGDMLELDNELENMIEIAECTSVQLTWMAYDLVAMRTRPEMGALMQRLVEAYRQCREAMEKADKTWEQARSSTHIDVDDILKGLESMSNCMNQLALRSQLKLCDLIVCVGSPVNLPRLKNALGNDPTPRSLTRD